MEVSTVFHNESDVSEFVREHLQEGIQDSDAVESFLKGLPEKVWQELILSYERVIREEIQTLVADAISEEEDVTQNC